MQLKAGDLGEKEYTELKDKEEIQSAASSFGKILFKRPSKKVNTEVESEPSSSTEAIKRTEIDLIFNLNEKGEEEPEEEKSEKEGEEGETSEQVIKKKIYLDNEQEQIKAGLQPPAKKRFIDGPTSKVTNLSASKVLARESKAGNKKLLSFYDEEQEELEEFSREDFRKKQEREQKRLEEQDSD